MTLAFWILGESSGENRRVRERKEDGGVDGDTEGERLEAQERRGRDGIGENERKVRERIY